MEYTYDPALVALSIAIAILGSFTGLVMTAGIQRVHGPEAALRIMLGSIGVGCGVWSMHFVAMLAVILPIELRYETFQTVLSAVLAMIFTCIAFSIVGRNRLGAYSLPVSAVFLGLGIGGMHYLGMNAVQGNCVLGYSWLGVVISVVIAIQASAVALWFAFRERGLFDTILGAIALGLAIASMHYTAMEATRFLPGQGFAGFLGHAFSERYLALSISIAMYGICGVCIMVFSVLTFVKRAPSHDDRRPAR